MSNRARATDISSFLAKAKNLLVAGNYIFVPRKKNMQSLSDHRLSIADAKEEILGLVVGDYYKGPKPDLDQSQPGDVWEFKKVVAGEQFYVKLKIQERIEGEVLKCLSFHEDEYI